MKEPKSKGSGQEERGRFWQTPPMVKLMENKKLKDDQLREAIEAGIGAKEIHIKDVNAIGETALHWAVKFKRPGLIEWLIKAMGADPNARGEWGESALDLACQQGDFGLKNGNAGSISALLASGADPALTDDMGRSALHWAAAAGSTEACAELLKKGALWSAEAKGGGPWSWALRASAREGMDAGPWSLGRVAQTERILDELLALGANLECRSEGGGTMLLWAAKTRAPLGLGHYLLSRGANPNAQRNADGVTPLRAMGFRRDFAQTPLGLDYEKQSADWVAMLLDKGGNPLISDHQGLSAVDDKAWERGSSNEARRMIQAWAQRQVLEAEVGELSQRLPSEGPLRRRRI